MSSSIIEWPIALVPLKSTPELVAFTRGGGPSIGGVNQSVSTDLGYWRIAYENLTLNSFELRRIFQAISQILNGTSGLIAVPVWSTSKWGDPATEDGESASYTKVNHSDGTPFSDGTSYIQSNVNIETNSGALTGSTQIEIKIIQGSSILNGAYFDYNYALYKIGKTEEVDTSTYLCNISPSIRNSIPAGASLNFAFPRSLCRLGSEDGMTNSFVGGGNDPVKVGFQEATDYWNRVALGIE